MVTGLCAWSGVKLKRAHHYIHHIFFIFFLFFFIFFIFFILLFFFFYIHHMHLDVSSTDAGHFFYTRNGNDTVEIFLLLQSDIGRRGNRFDE
jgi:heme/copper-type cytochrome/quinol oxidase subunit 2